MKLQEVLAGLANVGVISWDDAARTLAHEEMGLPSTGCSKCDTARWNTDLPWNGEVFTLTNPDGVTIDYAWDATLARQLFPWQGRRYFLSSDPGEFIRVCQSNGIEAGHLPHIPVSAFRPAIMVAVPENPRDPTSRVVNYGYPELSVETLS